ncbi:MULTISPECIES: nuclear transport factor 2 family protein [Pseudonocardia]|uniref:SnoaL-like domain protein n=2 Tax=Pseudonocardia TaxID=1847 RepID=A0A1Y2MY65_PSEAH|nr:MULTISPECIES: nuclear transport factor 2 family protein [Pseudonocardia]OSY40150.1 SnoaL-like domain protein [Pseudonocardia autotrophica]TDN72905.1 SnoaL-like protein [Pseudonocardia autotrophica]BBG03624.1 isomerase [Pseudonocardia autotrophica]GEC26322.1 isomerase [Pseudonocardia saturnea]
MTETTTDFTALARRYVEAFNRTDPGARRRLVAELFAPGCRYVDPLADVTGHDGVDGFLGTVQDRLPGFEFRLLGDIDAHHDRARFRWQAAPPESYASGAEPPVIGFDVIVLDAEGRIEQVHGFLDAVPAP